MLSKVNLEPICVFRAQQGHEASAAATDTRQRTGCRPYGSGLWTRNSQTFQPDRVALCRRTDAFSDLRCRDFPDRLGGGLTRAERFSALRTHGAGASRQPDSHLSGLKYPPKNRTGTGPLTALQTVLRIQTEPCFRSHTQCVQSRSELDQEYE